MCFNLGYLLETFSKAALFHRLIEETVKAYSFLYWLVQDLNLTYYHSTVDYYKHEGHDQDFIIHLT